MPCHDYRDLIMRDNEKTLNLDQKVEMERHLAACRDCRAFFDAYRAAGKAAQEWQEVEPPSDWRMGLPLPSSVRLPLWQTLLPVAAVLLMGMLVLFRVQFIKDDKGFRISFAGQTTIQPSEAETVDAAAMKAYLEEVLERSGDDTANAMRVVLTEFRKEQKLQMEELIADLDKTYRDERREDLQALARQWEEQREEDLDALTDQMRVLVNRQNRNTQSLYSLASYVNKDGDRARVSKEKL